MLGRSRTRPGRDLATIFFHIRTERDAKTRRSWQRRARIALAAVPGLTDAERHEIIAVWSRLDCSRIDSPAMRKLLGSGPVAPDYATIPAKSVMSARFDADGKATRRRRRPGLPGLAALHADAANDAPPRVVRLRLVRLAARSPDSAASAAAPAGSDDHEAAGESP
ncbi:MAG: hypothetical protein JSR49_06060 [Proteobacteria bacterium]|nr:hypothetical protein [Pseudomonadota bacterium]